MNIYIHYNKHYIHLVNNINLLLNSILTSISRLCKSLQQKHKTGVESYKKNFTKVANMTSLRLKNNLAMFSHALKNILKNDKKLGFIYKSEIL